MNEATLTIEQAGPLNLFALREIVEGSGMETSVRPSGVAASVEITADRYFGGRNFEACVEYISDEIEANGFELVGLKIEPVATEAELADENHGEFDRYFDR